MEAQVPDFKAAQKLCDLDCFVAHDLPAAAGLDPEGALDLRRLPFPPSGKTLCSLTTLADCTTEQVDKASLLHIAAY